MNAILEQSVPVDILLVEDNPGDIRLTEKILQKGKIANNLHVATDGEDALDFLYRKGKYPQAVRPHLILLDLNLPKKSGREVLEIIKKDPSLTDIPVCVLTSSKSEEDIVKSYKLNCNCYIVKPVDFRQFANVIHTLNNFWFEIVTIPNPRISKV